MRFTTNVTAQSLATILHTGNLTLWSGRLQVVIGLALAILQAVVAAKAHWNNPDGSPAEAPYSPDARM